VDSANLFIAVGFAGVALFLLLALLHVRQWSAGRGNKLPLTKRYLRPPGESLRLRIEALDGRILDTTLWLLATPALLAIGVYALLTDSLPLGAVIIALALAAMIYLSLRLEKQANLRRDCYLGFLGERAVGEELNQLMSDGWSVFHDVEFDENPGAKPFNVDHVVVGPGGLFAIETKTRRKRKESGGHEVTFNGHALEYPWGSEDYGVRNAQERAHYLSQWLSKKLQTDITATPVLILAGWYVHRTGKSNLTVINNSQIPTLFRDEHNSARLKPETVSSIRALLDERCRDARV
jgi:hypothetical protein